MKRALVSVSDKTGLVKFVKELASLGYEIVSTGGTFKEIHENEIPVQRVSDVTGFPEILDGRVKTLHPAIHGGILARDDEEHEELLKSKGIARFNMVIVNLYPFEKVASNEDATESDLIENIDIGGPTMIRAAAKNFQNVAVVIEPAPRKLR